MNKPTTSLLLVAIMAISGSAFAQDTKPGTQGGAGPTGASGMGDNGASVTTRAAVKAEAAGVTLAKPGAQGGAGPTGSSGMGDNKASVKSRAEVKGEITRKDVNTTVQGGSGASATDNANTKNLSTGSTASERKAKRDARRAAQKAKRDSQVNATTGPAATSN